MNAESKGVLEGFFILLFLISLLLLTYLFLEGLMRYSGITTFYSLLFLFLFFCLNKYLNFRKQEKKDLNVLRMVLRWAERTQNNLECYLEVIKKNMIQIYNLSFFKINLPVTTQKKSTRYLSDFVSSANDNIDALNEIRREKVKLLLENILNERNKKRALEKYTEAIDSALDKTTKSLKDCLGNIKEELKSWHIY